MSDIATIKDVDLTPTAGVDPARPYERVYHPTDPAKGDPPREVNRVKVALRLAEGCSPSRVAGVRVQSDRDSYAIVYADELPTLLAQVRTPDDERVVEQAKRMAERDREKWFAEQNVTDEDLEQVLVPHERERQRVIRDRQCPIHWSQFVEDAAHLLGQDPARYRGGMAKLAKVEVLDAEMGPPETPANLAKKEARETNHAIADAIRDGLREAILAMQGGASMDEATAKGAAKAAKGGRK
jgi:hypothetical protein